MRLLIVAKKANADARKVVTQGHLRAGSLILPCAIGRSSRLHDKREGDGGTPVGAWPVLYGFFRPDRMPRPRAACLLRPLARDMGWCDEPASPAYNRLVRLPFRSGHERMWRDDGLYDVVIVLGYNLSPRRKNRGSAIFLHCARDGFPPTAGCIALRAADLRRLLPRLSKHAVLIVR